VQIKNLPRCTRRDALERRRSTSGISDSRVGIDRLVALRACGTVIDAKTYGLNARQGQVGDAGQVAEHRRAAAADQHRAGRANADRSYIAGAVAQVGFGTLTPNARCLLAPGL
jgi:hypothetical protein